MALKIAGRMVAAFANRVSHMVAGFTKDFTSRMSLTIGGVSMTQPQILARLADIAGLFKNVTTAKSAYEVAVAAKSSGLPLARLFMTNLDQALRQNYGKESPVLPDFGLSLPKARRVRTPQEKVISTAHAKETRKLHNILGAQQRAKITVEGKPGLVLLDANGQPIEGALTGPTPPGSGTPVKSSGGTPTSGK